MLDDLVFAMAVRTQGRLHNAVGQRLAVHAVAILLHYGGVAHSAGVGNRGAKRLRLGREQFMRRSVTQAAVGRAFVAGLPRLAMHATGVLARLVFVARGADGFGYVGRMGVLLVGFVAGVAGQPRVSALRQFLPLVMTGCAVRWCAVGGCEAAADYPEK